MCTDGWHGTTCHRRLRAVATSVEGALLAPSTESGDQFARGRFASRLSRKYKFDVAHGKEAIALMIGNALPPPFIAAHAERYVLAF